MDLERLEIAINARIDGFEASIDKAEKGLLRIATGARETGESLTKYVTLPLGLLAGAAIKTAGDMQALEKGFAAVYKGAGDVGTEIQKTLAVAKLPGLGLQEALRGATNLQAAGFSADQARASLLAFGNALATVGKGKAELDRVVLALTQLSNSSKISQQDLNQLKEVLPQLGTVLKSSFNGATNAADLRKLGVTGRELVATLTAEFGKLPKVTGGIKNALENLSDVGVLALDTLGTAASNAIGLEDLANKISDQVTAIAEDFASLDPATQKTILGVGAVAAGVGPVLVAFGTLAPAVYKGVKAFEAFGGSAISLATAMGPVGISVAAVAAGLVYFAATSKSATEQFQESAKAADGLAGQLTPLLDRYDELSKKTKLTAEEQQNLKATIQRIGEVTPGAITATDAYGKAMSVNTDTARTYLKVLQDIAKVDAAKALPEAQANFKDLTKRVAQTQAELDKLNKQEVVIKPRFNAQGLRLPDEVIKPNSDAALALRKDLSESINLTKKAQIEALNEVNNIRRTVGLVPLKENGQETNAFVEARKAQLAAEKARSESAAKATADRKQSIDQLEEEVKELLKTRDALDKLKDAAKIGKINIEIDQKQTQIKQIKELGVGSKSDRKAAAKEISDQQKAQDALNDSLRKADLLYKEQGDKFDVAGAKAAAYQTYLEREIELDKTGKVESTAKFQAILTKYGELTEASKQFKENADISKVFTDTEVAIAAAADQILGLGKYAGTAKEQVKVLEAELAISLNGIEDLRKKGAGENDAFLLAEREHAKELTAELEKARAAAKQAKIADDSDDLLDAVNGGSKPGSGGAIKKLTGNSFGDLLSGKAVDELEERLRKAQQAVRDLQEDGGSQAQIEQAKEAVEGLKGKLDLTDVYAGAAQQAQGALANIADVVVEGIGGIITGQTSVVDSLKGIFGKTLSIVGDFMKDFGKQLLLLGAGHVALGLATLNPAMVTAGGLELAAGGALTLAGYLVSAAGSAVTPSSGSSSTPTTSASGSPSTSTKAGDKQQVTVKVEFEPIKWRLEGPALTGLLSRQKDRQNMR